MDDQIIDALLREDNLGEVSGVQSHVYVPERSLGAV